MGALGRICATSLVRDLHDIGTLAPAVLGNDGPGLAAASASNQGSSLSRSKAEVMQMLARAQSFVAAKDTASASASRVRFLSVNEGFR